MITIEQQPYFIHALILAAGQGKRFESTKQLALINGKPMVTHTTLIMKQAAFNNISVVLGAKSEEVEQALKDISLHSNISEALSFVVANNWQQGMGASIATGINTICSQASHVFVGLADQVAISAHQYELMIGASKQNPTQIIAASYNQCLGVPAIFPRAYFAKLAELDTDEGARSLLRTNKSDIIAIELPEAAKDIDTQLDLRTYISNTYKGTEHD